MRKLVLYQIIKFQNIDKDWYEKVGIVVCIRLNCKNMPEGDYGRKHKIFERYVDDPSCTAKDDPSELLQEVNDLHPNLKFTIDTLNDKHE